MPKKLTLEEMQRLAKLRGGECLSKYYVNAHKKLRWRCKEGHVWKATAMSVKNSGTWCPMCAPFKRGETIGSRHKYARTNYWNPPKNHASRESRVYIDPSGQIIPV